MSGVTGRKDTLDDGFSACFLSCILRSLLLDIVCSKAFHAERI